MHSLHTMRGRVVIRRFGAFRKSFGATSRQFSERKLTLTRKYFSASCFRNGGWKKSTWEKLSWRNSITWRKRDQKQTWRISTVELEERSKFSRSIAHDKYFKKRLEFVSWKIRKLLHRFLKRSIFYYKEIYVLRYLRYCLNKFFLWQLKFHKFFIVVEWNISYLFYSR